MTKPNCATPTQRANWYKKIGYVPRVGQKALDDAVDSGKRFASLFAFPRAGKSYGAAHHLEADLLCADHHAWIVAPKYELGSKEFLYVWEDFAKHGILDRATVARSDVRSGNMVLEFPWGAFLRVISADNPSSLRAEELDTVVLAEASALNEVVFERHLYARTEKRQGKVIIPTTPMGKNWVYEYFRIPSRPIDPQGQRNARYDPLFWSAVLTADPELLSELDWDLADLYEPGIHLPETIERAKRLLPRPIYIEQFGGGFASYAGLVLPFDPIRHVVPHFPIPDHWTHVVGWDHGATQDGSTAIIVGSYDHHGVLHVWGEIYAHGFTAGNYLQRLRNLLGPNKAISSLSVDPSAKQVRIELNAVGQHSTIPMDKQIMAGVIRLTEMLRDQKIVIHEGTCPNLERELWRMEWDEKNPQKIKDDYKYHCISALRYMTLVPAQYPEIDLTEPFDLNPKDPKSVLRWQKKKFWKGHREEQARIAAARRAEEMETLFEGDDPFDEVGTWGDSVDDFDWDGGLYDI